MSGNAGVARAQAHATSDRSLRLAAITQTIAAAFLGGIERLVGGFDQYRPNATAAPGVTLATPMLMVTPA